MATPTLTSVQPAVGPSSGGDLIRLVGTGFAAQVRVLFDGAAATVAVVREEGGASLVDLRTPAHGHGIVAIEVQNLDAAGVELIRSPGRIDKHYATLDFFSQASNDVGVS